MYNSAFLVGPDMTVLGRYDKIHLVPFGEYIPLRRLLFFLDNLVAGIGDFRSGEAYTVMAISPVRFAVSSASRPSSPTWCDTLCAMAPSFWSISPMMHGSAIVQRRTNISRWWCSRRRKSAAYRACRQHRHFGGD